MENHTAKHFVLQLSSLLFLYVSLSFLVVLAFGIINVLFPDVANGYYETPNSINDIRIGIAVVVVFFPTYVVLTRIVNKLRRSSTTNSYLTLTKWLIYLSLLIGGGVLLGDLAAVIMTFLNGEITTRFICKAISVLVVVGAAFYYYILDAKGFWMKHEDKSVIFAVAAIVIVLATVGFGFTKIGTPTSVREQKIDDVQINDLRSIQSQVEQYYILNKALPETLSDLSLVGTVPTAPAGRDSYTYGKTDIGFELCATFQQASTPQQYPAYTVPMDKGAIILNPENWQHESGKVCFKRAVGQLSN